MEKLRKRKDENCYFPDGYEYCENFLKQKREKNEDFIIIKNTIEELKKEAIQFYDTNALFENLCDEEYVLKNNDELKKEIDKIKHIIELRDKFANTNWRLRQYIDYKLDLIGLIEEQIRNNGKIRVLIRLNRSYHFSMYYFKA